MIRVLTFICFLAGLACIISKPACAQTTSTYTNMNAKQFAEAIGKGDSILLDVRTPGEVQQGRIRGARNIDFTAPDFDANLKQLDPEKQYLVYCRSGSRSAGACSQMARVGFKNLVNLEGGIIAWQRANLPVEPGK